MELQNLNSFLFLSGLSEFLIHLELLQIFQNRYFPVWIIDTNLLTTINKLSDSSIKKMLEYRSANDKCNANRISWDSRTVEDIRGKRILGVWKYIFDNISKMIIFGKHEFLLQMNGLYPKGGLGNIGSRIIFSVVFVLFISLTMILFILNYRRDIDRVLPLLPIFFLYGAIIATYFYLVINREQFHSLLDELQDIVHESV